MSAHSSSHFENEWMISSNCIQLILIKNYENFKHSINGANYEIPNSCRINNPYYKSASCL